MDFAALKADVERRKREAEALKQDGAPPTSSQRGASSSAGGLSHHAAVLSLPRSEVARRLRRCGQVVTFFSESDAARAERLYRYEVDHVAERAEVAVQGGFELSTTTAVAASSSRGASGGARTRARSEDEFLDDTSPPPASKRQRHAGVQGDDAQGEASGTGGEGGAEEGEEGDGEGSVGSGGGKHSRGGGKGGGGSSSSSALPSAHVRTTSADAAAYAGPGGDAYKYVYKYFRGLLNEWEDQLGGAPEEERGSPAGLAASRLLKQCRDFIRPLFRQLKNRTLPKDILSLSAEMVDHCRARNYHMAGDAYIRMAIGNAAWPIGVSAVGLHERAAREKVAEGIQAHVMNDEAQRKYITTLKRLVSFAQDTYPSDPSRSMKS